MQAEEHRSLIRAHSDKPERKRYCVLACHVLWRELCHFAAASPHVYSFRFLEQGLHNTPDLLRENLQAVVDEEDPNFDALLIGYGLCSNGIQGIHARTKPLIVVRAHDCITFLLGSKERYREYFDSHPGTYWYSPGWIEDTLMPGKERYEAALRMYTEQYGEESAKYLMEVTEEWISNYSHATYVDLGVGDAERFRDYTRHAAACLDWRCDLIEGDPKLIRAFLDGEWNNEDFLTVEPGHEIVQSFEDSIVTSRMPE